MELRDNLDISFDNKENIKENFEVKENARCQLFLSNFGESNELFFDLKRNAFLQIGIIVDKAVKDLKITANVEENSQIIVYFAEFSIETINLDARINLNEIGASAEWHLASLSSDNDNKKISVSIIHNAPETTGKVDNYGVVKKSGKLLFSGTSHIINGSIKSKTNQNAKIMVFDSTSDAIAKPILKIDENDIEASHAAAVGKISDEHLFYLTSRGISMDEARTLITLGYLKPIFKGFDEEKVAHIDELIGGRL